MGFEFFSIEHVNNKVGESDREEEVFCQYFETICTSSLRSGHFKLIRGFVKSNFADFLDLPKIVNLIISKRYTYLSDDLNFKTNTWPLSHTISIFEQIQSSQIIRFVYIHTVCVSEMPRLYSRSFLDMVG